MDIDILPSNGTSKKVHCIQVKKKHTTGWSIHPCFIKGSELSASIVTSTIFFDGIGHIIGDCHHPSCLWVCDWSIFDNKGMLTGLHGEAGTGKVPFMVCPPDCGAPLSPHMIWQHNYISFCSHSVTCEGVQKSVGTRSLENYTLEELMNYNFVLYSQSHCASFSLMELNWFPIDRVLFKKI